MVGSVIYFLSVLSLVGWGFIIVFIATFFISKMNKKIKTVSKSLNFLSVNAIIFIFIISSIATLGSLFLSEIAHFNPCKLCWYQRIFMYPIAIVSGIALIRNEKNLTFYILVLSVVGFLIAAYHYSLQMLPLAIPCSDEIASCSAKQFANFGFITIPFMSATAFGMLILLGIFGSRRR